MTFHYLDPSAWVKRYFDEAGSAAVAAVFEDAQRVACSRLGLVEIAATIARKGRDVGLSSATLDALLSQAYADFADFEAISPSDEIVKKAGLLAFARGLRMGDALHLASAMSLAASEGMASIVMVSADVELLAAAAAEGLTVLNPGKTP
jgi:hypothetical protein